MDLPLGRKLPLLISGLILLVLLASSGAAYLEVERSATTNANERVASLAKQLGDMLQTSVVARGAALRRVANDTAIRRLLRTGGTGALDVSSSVGVALERLVVPTDSDGLIEVWDQAGHPRARFAGRIATAQAPLENAQREMLVSHESVPGALDSVRTSPFYARGDSVFTWYAQPVVYGGLVAGYVAQRVRLANDATSKSSQRGLREIMGPGVDLYLANAGNDLRTTTTGELSQQPAVLKAARGPVQYHDPATGDMLGAKSPIAAAPWIVEIAMPRATMLERPIAFLRRMSVVALITLLVGAFIAWAISRQVTKPLAELTEVTHALSTGNYARRVRITRRDELGQLGDAFNLMAARISESRTAIERQSENAESARQEAVAASQAKSDFLAVMSHELRTPLNAILGFSSLLIDQVTGPITEQQHAQLTRIRSGGQHLLSLIDEILSLSRLEAGKEEVRIETDDAFFLARETAALAEPMAALKGLTLVTTIPSGTCEARTDFTKLRQIVLNLLSNAIKFTNEGVVTLAVHIDDDDLVWTVSDTGIGIAAEDRARIFEPFFQVEMSKSRRVAGTGLGLSVTRHLAQLLGGDVELLTRDVPGTTFEVRVPRYAEWGTSGDADRDTRERLGMSNVAAASHASPMKLV
ncbi:MAG: HAMP domain-containing histidine kinase [Gemmatimonadaceae bacterium]|nr:HAMP domain-containing histidine kinase [Gemmatimonadaceae bacterium]